jgi:hypothetical protein
MIAPDGRLIPFLIVPGNHDLSNPENTALFLALFAFPTPQFYRAVDFGNYLQLLLLDTGYASPIAGAQTSWLQDTLSQNSFSFRFAVYHEGAYPAFYPYNNKTAQQVRAHWCPLFDRYNLPAAFEHHSHSFKRTYPLKAGQVDPAGTLYLGDGCWGVYPRTPNNLWYLEEKGRENHVYLLELTPSSASIQALGLKGQPLDQINLNIK